MNLQIDNFWKWFSSNEAKLFPERITDNLISKLDKEILSLGDFSWEIREGRKKSNLLIISPGGDIELMEETLNIISKSPNLPSWEFLHYKPAKDWDFKLLIQDINGNDEAINVSGWEYVLLKYEDETYDIIINPNDSKFTKREDIIVLGDIVLESILGEKLSLDLIKNIDFVNQFEKEHLVQKSNIVNLKNHVFEMENIS